MTDILKLLPPFEWRGRQYPVLSRSVSFTHENVQHKLQYRAGELVEQTGARNRTFTYTLAMREDIAKGPYKDLFTGGLPQLVKDTIDRSPGTLLDPVYGEFQCVCTSFNDDSDPNKRDGTDIRVEFLHAPELEEEDPANAKVSLGGLSDEAGALNEELEATEDFEQFVAEEGATDVLSAVAGAGAQLERQANKVSAALDDLAFRCEKVEEQADRLENPQNWPLRRSARRTRETAVRLKRRGDNPQERILVVVQRYNSTLSAVAAEAGMTTQEFLKLNPALAKSPRVPAGTQYQKRAR